MFSITASSLSRICSLYSLTRWLMPLVDYMQLLLRSSSIRLSSPSMPPTSIRTLQLQSRISRVWILAILCIDLMLLWPAIMQQRLPNSAKGSIDVILFQLILIFSKLTSDLRGVTSMIKLLDRLISLRLTKCASTGCSTCISVDSNSRFAMRKALIEKMYSFFFCILLSASEMSSCRYFKMNLQLLRYSVGWYF